MEITLGILLFPYAFLLMSFFVFGFFNLYHMITYGFVGTGSFIATFLFLAGTTIILFLSYSVAVTINWEYPIIIANSIAY